MTAARGTGITTRQMRTAPRDAVYVWPNGRLGYPMSLRRSLDRLDLRLVTDRFLTDPRAIYGLADAQVVIDHAVELTPGAMRGVRALLARGIDVRLEDAAQRHYDALLRARDAWIDSEAPPRRMFVSANRFMGKSVTEHFHSLVNEQMAARSPRTAATVPAPSTAYTVANPPSAHTSPSPTRSLVESMRAVVDDIVRARAEATVPPFVHTPEHLEQQRTDLTAAALEHRLAELTRAFDGTYVFSDDPSVRRAGEAQFREICAVRSQLENLGRRDRLLTPNTPTDKGQS